MSITFKNLLFVINFTPVARDDYRVGVPRKKQYKLVLNSDDVKYGGNTNPSNDFYVTKKKSLHNQNFAMNIKLPSFGAIIFRRVKNVSQARKGKLLDIELA